MYLTEKRKREPCPSLPAGWTREATRRERGVSAGKLDVYYWSPEGRKFRSKPELMKELGDTVDLTNFDFTTGKMVTSLMRGSKSKKDGKAGDKGGKTSANANLNSLIPPIRQTASIFKQPVTVLKTHKTDVKKNLKTDKDKPRQLFWERRLDNISPHHEGEDEDYAMNLPEIVNHLKCLGDTESTAAVLASLSTALHLDKKPVVGQSNPDELEKNFVNLNPEQPMVAEMRVSEQQIQDQEKRVLDARNRLAKAMRALDQAHG